MFDETGPQTDGSVQDKTTPRSDRRLKGSTVYEAVI